MSLVFTLIIKFYKHFIFTWKNILRAFRMCTFKGKNEQSKKMFQKITPMCIPNSSKKWLPCHDMYRGKTISRSCSYNINCFSFSIDNDNRFFEHDNVL